MSTRVICWGDIIKLFPHLKCEVVRRSIWWNHLDAQNDLLSGPTHSFLLSVPLLNVNSFEQSSILFGSADGHQKAAISQNVEGLLVAPLVLKDKREEEVVVVSSEEGVGVSYQWCEPSTIRIEMKCRDQCPYFTADPTVRHKRCNHLAV